MQELQYKNWGSPGKSRSLSSLDLEFEIKLFSWLLNTKYYSACHKNLKISPGSPDATLNTAQPPCPLSGCFQLSHTCVHDSLNIRTEHSPHCHKHLSFSLSLLLSPGSSFYIGGDYSFLSPSVRIYGYTQYFKYE